MNVAPVKTGKRGRPRFRHSVGVLEIRSLPGDVADWYFLSDELDLFGLVQFVDRCPVFFSDRDLSRILRSFPSDGKPLHVEVAFTGRFRNFPSSVFTRWEVRLVRFVA